MDITRYKNQFFILPVVFVLLSFFALGTWGLHAGIDLAGGSILQISYPDGRPKVEDVRSKVATLKLGEVRVQPSKDHEYILRQKDLTQKEKETLMKTLGSFGKVNEIQFNSIGPSIGHELYIKALYAIVLVTLAIILFIAFVFRHVSRPVASWKYGVVAIVTLLHDIILPAGVFAYLGHIRGAEVDALFIVALLTVLGISINDTIVVFDRIRENLKSNEMKNKREVFGDVVGRSVTQTLARSINTSMTVIIVLAALFYLGPASTKDFALTLIIGMVAGTYSSIFLAAPLLVSIEGWQKKHV